MGALEQKDLVAMIVVPLAIVGATVALCLLSRLRDWAFFGMTAGAVLTEKLDINLLSQHWYRGTTRGFEFSFVDVLAWALVITTILTPRWHQKRFYWPASFGFMLLYFAVAIFSVSTSEPKIYGMFELSKILRAIVVFWAAALFVQSEREIKLLVLGIATAVIIQGVFAMKHKVFLHLERATGTLDHANSLSMYLCLTGPFLVAAATSAFPRWMRYFCYAALGMAAIGILLTVSRAGIPAFTLVVLGTTAFCISWKITMRKVLVTSAILAAVAAMVALSWDSLKARYGEATLEDETSEKGFENRGHYIALCKEILRERPNGVGLNNWSYWVSKRYGELVGTPYEDYDDIPRAMLESPTVYDWAPKYAPPAHNLAIITVGEMGWYGLGALALLFARWFWVAGSFFWRRSDAPTRRLGVGIFFGLAGVFLQSLTEWVFRQTAVNLTFFMFVGTLASLYYLRHREWAYQEAIDRQAETAAAQPIPRPVHV